MENEIERVHSSLAAIAGGPGTKSGPGTSYAEAAGCYVGKHVGPRMGQSNDLINAYWKSRKSARIASITGVTEAEMWDGLQAFFHDKMRIPRTEISISDIIEVKRVKVGRGRKGNDEVLVRFLDVDCLICQESWRLRRGGPPYCYVPARYTCALGWRTPYPDALWVRNERKIRP